MEKNVRRSSRPFQCWKILLRCHFTRRHSVFHSPRTRECFNHLCHPTKVRRGEEENTTNLTPFGFYYSFSSKPPTSPSNRPQHQIAHQKHIKRREKKMEHKMKFTAFDSPSSWAYNKNVKFQFVSGLSPALFLLAHSSLLLWCQCQGETHVCSRLQYNAYFFSSISSCNRLSLFWLCTNL